MEYLQTHHTPAKSNFGGLIGNRRCAVPQGMTEEEREEAATRVMLELLKEQFSPESVVQDGEVVTISTDDLVATWNHAVGVKSLVCRCALTFGACTCCLFVVLCLVLTLCSSRAYIAVYIGSAYSLTLSACHCHSHVDQPGLQAKHDTESAELAAAEADSTASKRCNAQTVMDRFD